MQIRGVSKRKTGSVRGALTKSWSKLKVLAAANEPAADELSSRPTRRLGERDSLAIRWFTPRGRELRQELLYDLRHDEGASVGEIVSELRRNGVAADRVDLRGIDLRGEDLAGASLARVDLRGANLAGCDLARANLRGADLSGANLAQATLVGIRLEGATLIQTNMGGANLCEARLDGARLVETNLRGAQLRRARLVGATLRAVDVEQEALRRAFLREPTRARATVRRARLGRPLAIEPRPATERVKGRTRSHVTRPVRKPAPAHARTRRASKADYEEGSRAHARKLVAQRAAEAAEGKVISSDTFARARQERSDPPPHRSFDHALAELIGMRGSAQRIVVVIDGHARVLYSDAERARLAG